MKDYQHYETGDFILDDDFLQWVRHADAGSNAFWEAFLQEHPQQQRAIAEAREFILAAAGEGLPPDFTPAEIAALRQQVQAIPGQAAPTGVLKAEPLRRTKRWYWAAACLAGVLLAAAFFYRQYTGRMVIVQSGYGEKKEVLLPDGSAIILNAHSTLSYPQRYGKRRTREVWLEGEAFFKVAYTGNPERFLLHAGSMEVTVLGTAFNVFNRHHTTRVSLNSGRIQVGFEQLPDTLQLAPGELVEYTDARNRYIRSKGNAALWSLWTENRIMMENMPVTDIIQLLADNYGLSVQCSDSAILRQKLSGELLLDNIEVLLQALSVSLETPVVKKDSVVTLGEQKSER